MSYGPKYLNRSILSYFFNNVNLPFEIFQLLFSCGPISKSDIDPAFGRNRIYSISLLIWAYSSVVERVHGMDEVGVRFSVGPPSAVAYGRG